MLQKSFSVRALLITSLVLVKLLIQVAGQSPSNSPLQERVIVQMIPLIVHVTDSKGQPIKGLTKEDFRILDENIPQQLQYFSFEDLSSSQGYAVESEGLRRIPALELVPKRNRIFLVLMGRGGIVDSFGATDDIIRFIKTKLLRTDRIGVMAYNRATELTADHTIALEVLDRYKKYRSKVESYYWKQSQGNGLANLYGGDVPGEIQGYIDKIFGVTSAEHQLRMPNSLSSQNRAGIAPIKDDSAQLSQRPDGLPTSPLSERLQPDPFDLLQYNALTDLSFGSYVANARMTELDIQNIYTALSYLRYLDGDKYILFFSDQGLFLPRLEDERSLAAMANDARVSIHTFQTGGMAGEMTITVYSRDSRTGGKTVSPQSVSLQRDYTHALSSLRQLAELTGGDWSVHSEIDKSLDQLDSTSRSYYLLGYDPGDIPWDGRYRHIKVEVNRSNVNLGYRHGYYADRLPKAFDSEEFLAYSRISTAANLFQNIDNIQFNCKLMKEQDNQGRPVYRVRLTIDPKSIRWQMKSDEYLGKLYLSVLFSDDEGSNSGSTWNDLAVVLTQADYARALQEGIQVSVKIPGKLKSPSFKAVVYDVGSDRIGSEATGWFARRR